MVDSELDLQLLTEILDTLPNTVDITVCEFGAILLGILIALRQNHQTAHWTVKGGHFYGDHLLFQRLYEEIIPEEIDALAEKMIGAYDAYDELTSSENILLISWHYIKSHNLVTPGPTRALHLELKMVQFVTSYFKHFKDRNQITLGVDDFLMSLVNNHEKHIYLLKQRLKEGAMVRSAVLQLKGSGNIDVDSAMILQSPNVHREVRDLAISRAVTNDEEVMKNLLHNKRMNQEQEALLEETPPTPDEILESYSYSDELGTLSRNLIERVASKFAARRGK